MTFKTVDQWYADLGKWPILNAPQVLAVGLRHSNGGFDSNAPHVSIHAGDSLVTNALTADAFNTLVVVMRLALAVALNHSQMERQ